MKYPHRFGERRQTSLSKEILGELNVCRILRCWITETEKHDSQLDERREPMRINGKQWIYCPALACMLIELSMLGPTEFVTKPSALRPKS